jgi:hypothetical protein
VKNYKDYPLIIAHCDQDCTCSGSVTTLRVQDGRYYLNTGSACTDAQMEIPFELFNGLVSVYIEEHGELPKAY